MPLITSRAVHLAIRTALVSVAALTAGPASAQLRIMTYNTSGIHSITAAPAASDDLAELQTIFRASGLESLNGVSRPVDVFLMQEVQQSGGADEIQTMTNLLNSIYGAGTYARSTNTGVQGTSGDDTQMLIYNTKTVQLIAETAVGVSDVSTSGIPRSPIRYQLRPKAPAGVAAYTSSADFYAYNSHYKSSDDSTSANRRNLEAQDIRADSNALGAGLRAIYAGDFNIYRSTEPMWGTLTAAGNGQAFDPLNRVGAWHNLSSFSDIDTQSSVTTARFGGEATGGLDDRFDWQMATSALLSNSGMSLLTGSYHALGNNGTVHPFNLDIDDSSNNDPIKTIVPGQNVLTALARASEHLPVVAQYKVPAIMGTALAAVPSQVLVGASLNAQVTVTNVAGYNAGLGTNSGNDLVTSAVGADTLSYSISASGAASGNANGNGLPAASLAASSHTHDFALSTATAGAKSATFSVSATSQQVPNASQMLGVNYTVLDHANASFTTPTDNNSLSLNFGSLVQGTAAQPIAFSVNNLVTTANFTAGLDLLNVGGAGSTSVQIGRASCRERV